MPGCNGLQGTSAPLQRDEVFDRVSRHLAEGNDIQQAMRKSNTLPNGGAWIHIPLQRDSRGFIAKASQAFCKDLLRPEWKEIGFYINNKGAWIHIGKVFRPPRDHDFELIAATALQLVNEARLTARRCGSEYFDSAPPLILSPILNDVAKAHARDMAEREYYSHISRDGSTVADRAKRFGYKSIFVSENNNLGPETIERSVSDWISSPGHCRNLMQGTITEMGIGYAVNLGFRTGVFWVQVFGNPEK